MTFLIPSTEPMKLIDDTGLSPKEVRKRKVMASIYGIALVVGIIYALIVEYL